MTAERSTPESIRKTTIPGLLVIERPTFTDDRGFFHEIARLNELQEAGVDFTPVQFNHSRSFPGVIRALHSEDWGKVIYPASGKMFVAIADVRPESETFGKVETFEFDMTGENPTAYALYLPPGIGNSICVIGDKPAEYFYAVEQYWDNSKARGIAWNDPDLNIQWPIVDPIVSDRDRSNPTLRQLYPDKFTS